GVWLGSGLRLIFPPGSSNEYSNLGYAILGEVITRRSGQDYREFVRERIIDPLGLHDTRYEADELGSVAPGYHREPALPGQKGGWTPQAPTGPGTFSPIGGLYSSVRDLATWAGLYLTRDVPTGVSFTAADLLEAQQPLNHLNTGPAEPPLRGYMARGYGYGLVIETFTDHGTVVSHSGGYPGFTTYMCWHKESGYTVISSSNGTHSGSAGPARRMLLPLVAAATSKPSLLGEPVDPVAGDGAARLSATIDTWPETLAAAARIEGMVREAPTTSADELAVRYADLFAENVEMDFPLARRVEYLKQALVNLGRLLPAKEGRVPTSERASRARWSVPAEFGRLELYIELTPVAPFQVQTFSVDAINGWSKVELF
ncbi:MAG TPA: serine hydrolase domain-containing protein, partial [Trueperaceae bacterium]|nr:serine hydrolase domain-containing protein [Trueperaceae bacterium]